MNQPHLQHESRFAQWLAAAPHMKQPTIITCDFDGTLVPRCADDEAHFTHVKSASRPAIETLLAPSERIGGVCTSRSILEVKRILDGGFADWRGRGLHGLSAAENGAVVFCNRLSSAFEETLKTAGYRLDHSIPGTTAINLSRVTPEHLRDSVVLPAVAEVHPPPELWSSSVGLNHFRDVFLQLFQMSKHADPQRTEDACVRFGSAYVKVYDSADGQGRALIESLQRHAAAAGVMCLVTPPLPGHPIWTADIGGGVTKYDAMKSISNIYSTLCGVPEDRLHLMYFGDGENDLPAFQYLSERGGSSRGFLVDTPHGNRERAKRVSPGTHFVEGFFDIAGVVEGVRRCVTNPLSPATS